MNAKIRIMLPVACLVAAVSDARADEGLLCRAKDYLGIWEANETFIYDAHVVDGMAFVSASTDGLAIVDVSDPQSPALLGTLDTPGVAREIEVVDDLAFIADSEGWLRILDVSDPASPVPIGSQDSEGWIYDLDVVGTTAYLGAYFGSLFEIVDVSDPTQPEVLASMSIDDVADVRVVDGLAYLAAASGLVIVDVSEPTSPQIIGSLATPGAPLALDVIDTVVCLADYNPSAVHLIDVSDPTAPVLTGSYADVGYAPELEIDGDLAFVVDAHGIEILDITSEAPMLVGAYQTSNEPWGVDIAEGVAYVADTDRLFMIDVTSPSPLPAPLSTWTDPSAETVNALVAEGDTLYVAATLANKFFNEGTLYVVDTADPASPVTLSSLVVGSWTSDLDVEGTTAYLVAAEGLVIVDVTGDPEVIGAVPVSTNALDISGSLLCAVGQVGIATVDISDPSKPQQLGTTPLESVPHDVEIAGDHAFVANYGPESLVVDLSDPASPMIVGSLPIASDFEVAGDLLFCGRGNAFDDGTYRALEIYDIADPANPVLIGSIATIDVIEDIEVHGDMAFAATSDYENDSDFFGLRVFDVSDPTEPTLAIWHDTTYRATAVSVSNSLAFLGGDRVDVFDVSDCGPCPADVNGDGQLNVLDFVAFQLLWQDGNAAADCDANGAFNVLDFVCFQGLFQQGCP